MICNFLYEIKKWLKRDFSSSQKELTNISTNDQVIIEAKKGLESRFQKINIEKEIKNLHDQGLSYKRLKQFGLEFKWIALYLQKKITKQEMINAFCRARGCEQSDLPEIQAQIQVRLDRVRVERQAELDAFPTLAKERMKAVALTQLAKESAEQATIDNAGVSL